MALSQANLDIQEHNRALRAKTAYIQLIGLDLNKLNDEQLFKVLTLVKNTAEENKAKESPPTITKNRSLFPPSLITTKDHISDEMEVEEDAVKRLVHKHGLIGGHGIFSMPRLAKDESADGYAVCVCFCVPDKLDCMVTIFEKAHESFFYKLTTAEVGLVDGSINEIELYSLAQLEQAIKNIKDEYNK